jgi:hypothetical protein
MGAGAAPVPVARTAVVVGVWIATTTGAGAVPVPVPTIPVTTGAPAVEGATATPVPIARTAVVVTFWKPLTTGAGAAALPVATTPVASPVGPPGTTGGVCGGGVADQIEVKRASVGIGLMVSHVACDHDKIVLSCVHAPTTDGRATTVHREFCTTAQSVVYREPVVIVSYE